ncbi:DNA mismatch repair protein MutS [Roseiarcus fermentans]|uniref:DNA mismatch repair protein MutS n=1 Tax=Roseiarcus fermentans TaxID=1473586 RepID=A0A366FE52_9HYPH|nr:DNA mismatch repair protein MutS [Roseiarcus fermentans]RBP12953.1 DNA mismatch repair protein MutS [Roseiarcus fermentans]
MDATEDPGLETTAPRLTPMMAQYFEIKAANPDCLLFYRMGDFYELFFDDAEVASRALGIVLTKRGKHDGEDIRMCGVPIERADDYLNRLIALGHRVAVCEQLEDPAESKKRGAKSVVKRDVVRLVTPGTITEDRLLEPGRARLLVAVQRVRGPDGRSGFGLAALDLSTGAFALSETDESGLAAEIARLEPSEIVAAQAVCDEPHFARLVAELRVPTTPLAREAGDAAAATLRVCEFYGVETLDGFGAFSRAEVAAAALALAYVKRTQLEARPALSPPTRRARGASLEIDPATRANLELTRTLGGAREGSLLATIDLTVTPAGARALAERLASPLTDPAAIAGRLDALGFLVLDAATRDALRGDLKGAPDFLRALARLSLDRAGPRDLAAVRDGLAAAAALARILASAGPLPSELRRAQGALRADCGALHGALAATLADDLPLVKRDGGFVRAGSLPALDEARALRDESRRVIAEMQGAYADQTGVRALKIKHNNVLGFYIETPQAQGEALLKAPLNATFIHRQTMAGALRFTTNALVALEAKIASAADRALALELDAFERLRLACLAESDVLRAFGTAIAEVDVAAALAELAVRRDWTRPVVDASLAFTIRGGRHPVVEAALKGAGEPFVANDCDLSGDAAEGGRIAVVTGPNMAGKSTYLRQNALIALIAQMGSYVPAAQAHVGVVDRLFSRVGAADDLARGRSTFMVEMVETAAILNQATRRSLVILDEIGRGTATFDGLSIAYACVEHLNAVNRSRTLFATHFHELTRLAEILPRIVNLTMRVSEFKGSLIFLHEVARGAADRSYGIQVAKLAGLPGSVVRRARKVLADLEASRPSGTLDSLPLFSFEPHEPPAPAPAPRDDALRAAVAALDPDSLSPREAHAALYQLKRLVQDRTK